MYSENLWPFQDVWIYLDYPSLRVYFKLIANNTHIRPLQPSSIFLSVKNLSLFSANLSLHVLGRQEQIAVLKKPFSDAWVSPSLSRLKSGGNRKSFSVSMPASLVLWITCLCTDDECVLSVALSTALLPLKPYLHPLFLTCLKLKKSFLGLTLYLSSWSEYLYSLSSGSEKLLKQGREGTLEKEWSYGHVPCNCC